LVGVLGVLKNAKAFSKITGAFSKNATVFLRTFLRTREHVTTV